MTIEKMKLTNGVRIITANRAFYPITDTNAIKWVKLPFELGATTHAVASIEEVVKQIEPHAGLPQSTITFKEWKLVGTYITILEDVQGGMFYWKS
tara:strand:+ start:1576 stop:1860 length:285 start_codon:yes stop_codon:yes gene_type:complete